MKALKEELETLRGQASDAKLIALIDTVLFKETTVSIDSWPIVHSAFDRWLTDKEKDIKSLDDALDNIRNASIELRENLQGVNRRIEELLAGDEAH